ncbi:PREDICTED: carboxy-terminal domain RNA polymerase II polypeptide A small phosphatase 2-like [Thamnophis sirtalis]|uniref:Carboxy-terminal domain RNA polymerase II polypeptide A small phosphatase 2-like n=1 Tax=Thamnophis sirtalis TaxID=35019 RepID=A0A6I9Z624_9SAUR|nr:PREDICTED: carboxy-terminal domain RNA polymerase II polypeptide A small phosphatase 2-like [Thamnophis sirtalis]
MESRSIITQVQRDEALVFSKQVLVSKSSPKKPRGRSIFKALFCCLRAQNVGQTAFGNNHGLHKEETNTIAKSDLLQCLQYQFYQVCVCSKGKRDLYLLLSQVFIFPLEINGRRREFPIERKSPVRGSKL